MTPEEEISRAGEARQLLDSVLFQGAKKHIEEQMAYSRRMAPIRDAEMHTRLILMEQLWGNLLGYFEQLAQTGQMAQLKLKDEERRRSFFERGVMSWRAAGRNGI